MCACALVPRRFEVPFNIWCNTCGEHIAKGVRFNAEKKQVRGDAPHPLQHHGWQQELSSAPLALRPWPHARPHAHTCVCSPCTAFLSRKQQAADAPPLLFVTPRHAGSQVGTYFSTKVWSFTMRHHCGCKITITTDPKNAEYLVTDGARRKIETYDPDDAQVNGKGGEGTAGIRPRQEA